jgi:hypothetical protein
MLYITVNNSLKIFILTICFKNKASEYGNEDIAQILIEKGSNIDSQDGLGRTPLIIGNLF